MGDCSRFCGPGRSLEYAHRGLAKIDARLARRRSSSSWRRALPPSPVPKVGCWGFIAALVIAQAACILLWRAGWRLSPDRSPADAPAGLLLLSDRHRPDPAARRPALALRLRRRPPGHREPASPRDHDRRRDRAGPTEASGTRRSGPGTVDLFHLPWFPAGLSALGCGARAAGFPGPWRRVWLAVRRRLEGAVRLLPLTDPGCPGFSSSPIGPATRSAGAGTTSQRARTSRSTEPRDPGIASGGAIDSDEGSRRFPGRAPFGSGSGRHWVHGFYLETALNAVGEQTEPSGMSRC